MIPLVDKEKCTGCKRCIEVCPPRAIELQDQKAAIDAGFCEECGLCAAECAVGAIDIPFPVGDGK
jgi:heterodisulfide reductase subunit A-like polyferredoxin